MALNAYWESLNDLITEWDALHATSQSQPFFLSTIWHSAWAQAHTASLSDHSVLALRDDGNLIAVAPLRETEGGVTFALDSNLTDYQDLLVRPGNERRAWEYLLVHGQEAGWTRIELVGLREDSVAVGLLEDLAHASGWRASRTEWDVSPYLDLPPSWDDYLQGLGKKDRHELRRKFRRLDGAGSIDYEVIDRLDGDAEADAAVSTFIRLMEMSGDEKAKFLTGDRRAFLTTMSRTAADAGVLRLCFLRINDVRTSAIMSFVNDGKWLLYNSGYDPEYRSQAVGLLLKAWSIRYAIENGLSEYDFLRGNEPYKYDLGARDRRLYRYVLER